MLVTDLHHYLDLPQDVPGPARQRLDAARRMPGLYDDHPDAEDGAWDRGESEQD